MKFSGAMKNKMKTKENALVITIKIPETAEEHERIESLVLRSSDLDKLKIGLEIAVRTLDDSLRTCFPDPTIEDAICKSLSYYKDLMHHLKEISVILNMNNVEKKLDIIKL